MRIKPFNSLMNIWLLAHWLIPIQQMMLLRFDVDGVKMSLGRRGVFYLTSVILQPVRGLNIGLHLVHIDVFNRLRGHAGVQIQLVFEVNISLTIEIPRVVLEFLDRRRDVSVVAIENMQRGELMRLVL